MAFCAQCGAANPDAARYCDQCGSALIAVPAGSVPQPVTAMPTSSAVVCAQCGTQAFPGEAFCDNCGAPLGQLPRAQAGGGQAPPLPPQPTYPPPQPVMPPTVPAVSVASTFQASTPPPVIAPATPPPRASVRYDLAGVRLVVIATGASIVLPAVHEAVVGRADAMSKFFPEVDLTPHGALDLGVGRRHARVFISNGQVMVEDLNSTNGTQLRGVKLAAKQPMVLAQGDEVVFGKLAMQILW